MRTEVLSHLRSLAEEKYRLFSAKLLPHDVQLLGVRIPLLRQYAKALLKEGRGEAYLQIPPSKFKYQEELMLYALLIAHLKKAESEKLQLIKSFVPYINSWAVCDIFSGDLKEIKKAPELYYRHFLPLTQSTKEYEIRFFYVIALGYFVTPELFPKILHAIKTQSYVGFYDKMAVAWFLSVAYVKFPKETEAFLLNTPLDKTVLQKAVSKINDSYRVKKEDKIRLRRQALNLYK